MGRHRPFCASTSSMDSPATLPLMEATAAASTSASGSAAAAAAAASAPRASAQIVAVSQLPPLGRARELVEWKGSACQRSCGSPGPATGRQCSTADFQPVA